MTINTTAGIVPVRNLSTTPPPPPFALSQLKKVLSSVKRKQQLELYHLSVSPLQSKARTSYEIHVLGISLDNSGN